MDTGRSGSPSQDLPSSLMRTIGFGRASQRPILYELASQTEAVPSPDHKEQPAEPDSTTFATEHLYFARAPSLLINETSYANSYMKAAKGGD